MQNIFVDTFCKELNNRELFLIDNKINILIIEISSAIIFLENLIVTSTVIQTHVSLYSLFNKWSKTYVSGRQNQGHKKYREILWFETRARLFVAQNKIIFKIIFLDCVTYDFLTIGWKR